MNKLSRKQLYDLVWSKSIASICKDFDVSYSYLRMQCKHYNIPLPKVGYWSKLKFGKPVKITPLQQDSKNDNVTIILSEQNKGSNDKTNYIDNQKEIEEYDESVFIVPEELHSKEPFIINTIKKHKYIRSKGYSYGYNNFNKDTLSIQVSDNLFERALKIFDTVIKVLKCKGYGLIIENNNTYAIIKNERIQIEIVEPNKRVKSDDQYSQFSFVPSGELKFKIYHYRGYYDNASIGIRDSDNVKLEKKIAEIIAKLEKESDYIKAEKIQEEESRKIREEEEKQRQKDKEKALELEKRREQEKAEVKNLILSAQRMFQADVLRRYIEKYEAYITENKIQDEEIQNKIKWAKEKIQWMDPFINNKDELLDEADILDILMPPTNTISTNTCTYSDYYKSQSFNFWSNPFRKRNNH